MRLRSLMFMMVATISLLPTHATAVGSEDENIKSFVETFFQAYEQGDLTTINAQWNTAAPEYSYNAQRFARLFARNRFQFVARKSAWWIKTEAGKPASCYLVASTDLTVSPAVVSLPG